MKRINPETGKEFSKGETRSDGAIFLTYCKTIVKSDGTFKEKWLTPDAAARQITSMKNCGAKWQARRFKERSEMLRRYKLSRGCDECGYSEHHAALDFDHKDRSKKSFDISKRYIFANEDKLWREIKKCRILCANCHRKHSYEENHHIPWAGEKGDTQQDIDKSNWYRKRLITQSGQKHT